MGSTWEAFGQLPLSWVARTPEKRTSGHAQRLARGRLMEKGRPGVVTKSSEAKYPAACTSIQMTADRYGHLFPRCDDSAELAAAERTNSCAADTDSR
jgi:hypothetical protein